MSSRSPDDPIAALQALLRRYPQVRYVADVDRITIYPTTPDGFEILLTTERDRCRVAFEGWHESYPTPGDALDVIELGLSPAARLEVCYCGRTPYRWTLQVERMGQWIPVSTVGLLLYPFWQRRSVRYFVNRLLQAA
jgi:hypothetical protein